MKGIIGKKIGMTSCFDENGKNIPCTVLEAGPCVVTQVKTDLTDGYQAVQLAYGDKKEKNTSGQMKGHFKKANTAPKKKIVEFRTYTSELGQEITVDVFEEGDVVDVVSVSKGKGFQGVVKRHGFGGVGMQTHGQHNRGRAPGSIGAASYPARVFKGMRMAGRMGNDRVKVKNVSILKVFPEKNILVLKGSIAGSKGAYVTIKG